MLDLRTLRGDRTIREVAIATGLTEATVSNAEKKPYLMSTKTIFAFSTFYGVTVDDIIDKKALASGTTDSATK